MRKDRTTFAAVWFAGLAATMWIAPGTAQEPPQNDPPPIEAVRPPMPVPDDMTPHPADIIEAIGDVIDEAAVDSATSAGDDLAVPPSPPPVRRSASRAGFYGYWTFLPPIVAIVLAVVTRQVIPSLFLAVMTGAYMMQAIPRNVDYGAAPVRIDERYGDTPAVLRGARIAVEDYMIQVTALGDLSPEDQSQSKVMIILFTLMIGGMVGVVAANGGTAGIVRGIAYKATTPRHGQALGWFSGTLVFFDDYANTMIVGPTMRPLFDKLKISREKLAYIVDSTAAPIASLALIGTWIGAEIGFIDDGLKQLDAVGRPEFMKNFRAYDIFVQSIPYRFYAIFTLVMVLLIALTGRDFGPMKTAERNAQRNGARSASDAISQGTIIGRWWHAGAPILVLIGATLGILYMTGSAGLAVLSGQDLVLYESSEGWLERAGWLLKKADPNLAILYGALSSLVVAVFITLVTRIITIRATMEAIVSGMVQMFPAIIILVLAWGLSAVMGDLQLAQVASSYFEQNRDRLTDIIKYVPFIVFLAAAIVSFSTGTSWGTMGILCPVVIVVVGGELLADVEHDQAVRIFYGAVGAVLAGAVFGDHCSPISDTTVLSATASGCSLESHVWTQLFYAVTAASVAVLCGDLLCMHFGKPLWVGLGAGVLALVVIVFAIGRKLPVMPREVPTGPSTAPPVSHSDDLQ